jgi:hypothetical protein
MKLLKKVLHREEIFFYILLTIGLLPIILNKYFLTLDGPSHLYNANIIKELLFGVGEEFKNLFSLNQILVPNLFTHFLLAFTDILFPDYISEKILLCSYLIIFSVYFRKIILIIQPNNKVFSYLGLLLAPNHLLFFGFYNLIFGIAIFLVLIYYLLKWESKINTKKTILLFLLFLVLYFCHILMFILGIAISLLIPLKTIKIAKKDNTYKIEGADIFLPNIKRIIISFIPALVLAVIYIFKIDSLGNASRMDFNTILNYIVDIRPLLTLCYCHDWIDFTHLLFGLIIVLIIVNLIITLKKSFVIIDQQRYLKIGNSAFNIIWFLLFIFFLILFAVVPNTNLMSERLILLLFLFIFIWIGTLNHPIWLHKLSFIILVFIHISFSIKYVKVINENSQQIELIKQSVPYIEKDSLMLTFNYLYNYNWLHSHSIGYAGSEKQIPIIENYEAYLKWFPIIWNTKGAYDLSQINAWGIDNKKLVSKYYSNPKNPDVFSMTKKDGGIKPISYIFILGNVDNSENLENELIKSIISKSYILKFKNELCAIYKLKK